jgi:hypothetical protein
MASDLTWSAPSQGQPAGGGGSEAPGGDAAVTAVAVTTLGRRASRSAFLLTLVFVVLTLAVEVLDAVVVGAAASEALPFWALLPVLALAPVVVVMMTCLHQSAPAHARAHSLAAVALAGVYAAIVAVNYMVQLVVVLPRVGTGDLTLLAMGTTASVFTALEATGYGFLALMALAAAAALARHGSERSLRWALVTTGVTGLIGAAGAVAARPTVMLVGFGLSLIAFLVAALLLANHFRAAERRAPLSQGLRDTMGRAAQ